ncbi:MAG: TrkA C-terminal domain-containing protein [Pseudomonadales bacterium]
MGQLVLEEGSPVIGGTVQDAHAVARYTMKILRIRRGDLAIVPNQDETLRAGDRLRVQDTAAHLTAYAQALGAMLYSGDSSAHFPRNPSSLCRRSIRRRDRRGPRLVT